MIKKVNMFKLFLFLFCSLIFITSIDTAYSYYDYDRINDSLVRVKLNVTSGNTQTLYISNSNTYSENPDNVYLLWDDFSGSSINSTKWNTSGNVYISGGYVVIGNYSSNDNNYLISATEYPINTTIEFINTRYDTTSSSFHQLGRKYVGFTCDYNNDPNYYLQSRDSSNNKILSSSYGTLPATHDYTITWTSNKLYGWIDGGSEKSLSYDYTRTSDIIKANVYDADNYDKIDEIRVFKYYNDNDISISCSDNTCVITSDIDLDNVTIDLTTTYTNNLYIANIMLIQSNISDYYNTSTINVSVNTSQTANISYVLDSGSKTLVCNNCNSSSVVLSSLSESQHNLTFIAAYGGGDVNRSFVFTNDYTPPTINLTSTETIRANILNISELFNVSDSSGVTDCYANFTYLEPVTNASQYNINAGCNDVVNITANGVYNMSITAQDNAGNIGNNYKNISLEPYIKVYYNDTESGTLLHNYSVSISYPSGYSETQEVEDFIYIYPYVDSEVQIGEVEIIFTKFGYYSQQDSFILNSSHDDSYVFNTTPVYYDVYDEASSTPLNMSAVDAAYYTIYCDNDDTYRYELTNNSFKLPAVCDAHKLRLDFTYSTESYFRTFYIPTNLYSKEKLYMIDLTKTQAVRTVFSLIDIVNEYEKPSLFVKKNINGSTTTIMWDRVDATSKVVAYLIENHQYILEVASINKPKKSLGYYIAKQEIGDVTLTLFTMQFTKDDTINYGNVFVSIYAQTNETDIRINFLDKSLTTSKGEVEIRKDGKYGQIVYTDSILNENTGCFSWDYGSYNNTEFYVKVDVTNEFGTQTFERIVNPFGEIGFGFIDFTYDMNWISVIFLGAIALTLTASVASSGALVLAILSAMFVYFGWLMADWKIIGISILLAIMYVFRESEKK